MGISGAQDFWVVGSRFYYRRDPVNSVNQPWIDLGVIRSVSPAIDIEKIELEDPDGGTKKIVDESVTKIDETWDITTANLNKDNLSLLLLGSTPAEFSQSATNKTIPHEYHAGRLLKLHDDDAAKTNLFNLSAICGVISALADLSTESVTDVNVSAKTITTGTDISSDLSNGDKIVLRTTGLSNKENATTYTVDSVSTTTITVQETPAGDETSITGSLIYKASGDTGTIYNLGTDWEVTSLDRGLLRILPGGALTTDNASIEVDFGLNALSGKRIINPQASSGAIKGDGLLIFGRDNNVNQDVREARVSITPSSGNFQVDDYSDITLSVQIISDVTELVPAGRLVGFKGSVPTQS